MIEWQKVKTEYITTDISIRELARKHGLRYGTVQARVKRENWLQLRESTRTESESKIVAETINERINSAKRLGEVAEKLLDKVDAMIDDGATVITAGSVKNLTGALRDLRDVLMIRSDADIREQEARIKKLQMEAQSEDEKPAPKLIVEGLPEEYKG